ncbi:MAG: MarR family winged helix-turn-helix transcriptional regulator [Lachnospiraceae bacterium]|nr:MarR family winged helix-turn-helix transcriptional regulator [Lachnospiraceae bacterium]
MKEDIYPMREMVNLSCVWHRVIEKQMVDLGLSSIQSRMIGYLYFQSRRQRKVFQGQLEEEFKIRKSSVTSVLQILEKKGLVRRTGVPGDARKKELVLTEQGIAVQETVIERLDRLEELVNQVLTEEERRLWFSCIRKIETRLEEAEYD